MDSKSRDALKATLLEIEKQLDNLRCNCSHKISEHDKGDCKGCECTCVVNGVWSVTVRYIGDCLEILENN